MRKWMEDERLHFYKILDYVGFLKKKHLFKIKERR